MAPASSPHRLLVVRHAKSAWPDVPDPQRPLAPRGRRQAPLVARWLRAHGYLPDLVLYSPARRAHETWQLMAGELGGSAQARSEERIYGASGQTLLDVVREAPRTTATLLVVGHDPGVSELTWMLAGGPGGAPAGALRRAAAKFPTGAAAILTFRGAWPDLGAGGADLIRFLPPRDLED